MNDAMRTQRPRTTLDWGTARRPHAHRLSFGSRQAAEEAEGRSLRGRLRRSSDGQMQTSGHGAPMSEACAAFGLRHRWPETPA